MESQKASPLPDLIPVSVIEKWLPEIFPEGTPNRGYVTRQIAAKTLFVMLYAGAVESLGRWIRPDQVTKMTNQQAFCSTDSERLRWSVDSIAKNKTRDVPGRWYAPNTREPIRDETLRGGLIAVGAVVQRTHVPTTSSLPRYAIADHFAHLLQNLFHNPSNATRFIDEWRTLHLSAPVLSRINLLRRGAVALAGSDRIKVVYPNGETRLLTPGPSALITKGVIEDFCPRFLKQPCVLFLSESAEKVVTRDEELARSIGFNIDFGKNLPDIILVDVHPKRMKLVFVEVVATDGPISQSRKHSLLQIALHAGFSAANTVFVTAFRDRSDPALRRHFQEIAWGTYVWALGEPECLIALQDGRTKELKDFLL